MVSTPEKLIPAFARAGADIITIHVEATDHIHGAIQMIKNENIAAGVVINPGTSVEVIKPVLGDVDMVLVMTVNPGWGGQAFIGDVMPKLRELRSEIDRRGLAVEIGVDGGVKLDTIATARAAGGEVMVVGSGLYRTDGDLSPVVAALHDAAG